MDGQIAACNPYMALWQPFQEEKLNYFAFKTCRWRATLQNILLVIDAKHNHTMFSSSPSDTILFALDSPHVQC